MIVLVLGAYGMLGHKMFNQLDDGLKTYGTCRAARKNPGLSSLMPMDRLVAGVDASSIQTVENAIKKFQPDAVVNCVGIIKQLKEAKDPIPSIEINSLFPHRLAKICRDNRVRLIHFSTDCVFSGKKGFYVPEDLPDAEDVYGRSKLLGEVSGEGCLTIRSSIIGRELFTRNGLLEWFIGNSGGRVAGYKKAIYSGFTTNEMVRIVNRLLVKHPDVSGVWHVASEPISKYDLLRMINHKMDLNIEVMPDESVVCDRSLDGMSFNGRTGYVPPSWSAMIDEISSEDATNYRLLKEKDVKRC
ncbi:MAG: SDR family oxidoreductase [Methanobacteriota archaeon]